VETDTHIHTYTHTHTHTHDMTHMENLRTEDAISKFKQGRVDFLSKQSACAKEPNRPKASMQLQGPYSLNMCKTLYNTQGCLAACLTFQM
jgi:hypothetical protein